MDYTNLFIESKLPTRLTSLETYEYFKKYKSGDLSAREQLIIHNIRLVIYQVNRFNNLSYDKQELVSVGLIGLIKAVDTFDIEKKIKFSTYATTCIDNEILNFIKSLDQHFKDESLEKIVLTTKEGNEFKVIDSLSDKKFNIVDNYEKHEIYSTIRDLIDKLSDIDKQIIIYYFGFFNNKPLTQKEIASKLNISRQKVSIAIARILINIKNQLNEQGLIDNTRIIKKKIK